MKICKTFEKNLIHFCKEYWKVRDIFKKFKRIVENFDKNLFNLKILLENI